jgi:hypothetical protein
VCFFGGGEAILYRPARYVRSNEKGTERVRQEKHDRISSGKLNG